MTLQETIDRVRAAGAAWKVELKAQWELREQLEMSRARLAQLREEYQSARGTLVHYLDPLAQEFRALETQGRDE